MSFRHQHRQMNVISEKVRCPSDTNTEQCKSYRFSYDVLQTRTQNNAYHIGKAKMSFRHQHRTMHVISNKLRCPSDTNTEQCMSYWTSNDVLQTLPQNNACHIGKVTMSFRHQHRTMHVISNKLRCPSDTNTEQCMSYRTSYNVLQTLKQDNACISDMLQCPSDTNTEQCIHIGQATMSFRH